MSRRVLSARAWNTRSACASCNLLTYNHMVVGNHMQSTVATPRSGRGEGHLLDLDREAAGVVADEDQDRLPVAFPCAADGAGGARVPTGLRVFAPVSPDERRVVADQGRCGPRRGGWPGLPIATGRICRSARRECPLPPGRVTDRPPNAAVRTCVWHDSGCGADHRS